jgi:hypothetical protein
MFPSFMILSYFIYRSCIHDPTNGGCPANGECPANAGPRAYARSVNIMLSEVTVFLLVLLLKMSEPLILTHSFFELRVINIHFLFFFQFFKLCND